MRCGEYCPSARQNVHNEPVHMFLLQSIWFGKEDPDSVFAYKEYY